MVLGVPVWSQTCCLGAPMASSAPQPLCGPRPSASPAVPHHVGHLGTGFQDLNGEGGWDIFHRDAIYHDEVVAGPAGGGWGSGAWVTSGLSDPQEEDGSGGRRGWGRT